MIYEECKATHLNDVSSRNNTPKHEAPLCARDWGINSNYFIMGPEGGGGGGGGGGPDPQDPLAGSALDAAISYLMKMCYTNSKP